MAVNKNFVVKNGLEVNSQLIFADAESNRVGIASTQPNIELDVRGGIAASNTTVSGVSTIQTGLRVGSGIAGTVFTALDDNVVGIGTSIPVFLLDVRDPTAGAGGTVFNVLGDSLLDHTTVDSLRVLGISTYDDYALFKDGFEVISGVGTLRSLNVLGLSTFRDYVDIAADVGITSTLAVGTGLSVSGISTFTGLVDINGGVTVTGISTFSSNLDINADVDINESIAITGGSEVTGISTVTGLTDLNGGLDVTGVSTFASNVDINADVDLERSLVVVGGIGVTGIGTINAVKIFNDGNIGIITANDPSGIVTYYGDGQFLTNIQSGVGIATTNPSTGYSEIVGLGATIITFAGPGVSTNATHNGGTGVTVNPASGIATVYLSGGGGGAGGYQTTIVRDSTTVGSGGQSIFTSSARYTEGYIDVFVNGTKLNISDFTETDNEAGTITLTSAALEGDIVELVNYAVIAITGDVETLITKEEYTVTTAGQTVFDLSAEYTTGYIDVYLNGVRLSSSDYTETSSTRVTLTTGATYGDILEFVIYEKRNIAELQPVWRNDGVGSGSGGIYTFTSVGVGTSAQTSFFEVYGSAQIRTGVVTITNSSDTDIVRITDGGFNVISGITTLGGNLIVSGDLDINGTGTHDIFGTVSLDNVQVASGVTIGGVLEVNGDNHSIDGTTSMGNINATGIVTANSAVLSQNLTVGNDLEVTGNLTVNGTTTTLDTLVQEVDLLNIQANSTTPGLGVTQSGAGAIIAAYDGASEVFRVNDGGNIGIGTDNPSSMLEVSGATPQIRSTDTDANNSYSIFQNSSGQSVYNAVNNGGQGTHIFQANGTERLRITSGGNLNIGGNYAQTTYTSQITGTLNVTGNITQNGSKLATTGKAIAMAMVFG